jgi:hypothetical protein
MDASIEVRDRDSRHLVRGVLLRSIMCVIGVLGVTISCSGSGDVAGPKLLTPSQTFWAIQLNQHALNLALTHPYDTAQLTVVPVNAVGTQLSVVGPAKPKYVAADSTVSVDSTGLVTARFLTQGNPTTNVIVSLQLQGVTLTDTVLIQVTPLPASPLATFSMQPAPNDSAKRAVDFNFLYSGNTDGAGTFPWPVTATDGTNSTVCNGNSCPVLVYYSSSNPSVATIDRSTGMVSEKDTGHVFFKARTLAYGKVMQDSVAFTIGYSLTPIVLGSTLMVMGVLTLLTTAFPKKLILGVGAVVTFCNVGPYQSGFVFNGPAAPDTASCKINTQLGNTTYAAPTGSGDITAIGGAYQVNGPGPKDTVFIAPQDTANCAARRFSVPGTYLYHNTLLPSLVDTIEIRKD